jgi:Mrp family chromosome partitioning ATPase
VILVIEAHRTRRLAAQKALMNLRATGARLLGTVLIERTFPIPARLYYSV